MTNQPGTPFKIEVLNNEKLLELYENQFTAIIRSDILSFHSSGKKFKAYVGIKKTDDNRAKYTLGCTCNTGNRFTGCVHSTLIIYLWSFYFHQAENVDESLMCHLRNTFEYDVITAIKVALHSKKYQKDYQSPYFAFFHA